ncbi:MAG: membrane protein insertion efficiency factor YidD [Marinoscillum sp.]
MRMLLAIGLVVFVLSAFGQTPQGDLKLLEKKVERKYVSNNDADGVFFSLYKKVFSDQILNDCIYDRSCSAFSKDVFENFGLIKGVMLTADRLTRCNRATYAEISKVHINEHGKALDHWDYYVKKK